MPMDEKLAAWATQAPPRRALTTVRRFGLQDRGNSPLHAHPSHGGRPHHRSGGGGSVAESGDGDMAWADALASRGVARKLLPLVYWNNDEVPPAIRRTGGGAVDPARSAVWRNGQFNLISMYKLALIEQVLSHGYNTLFSDVDIVLLSSPVDAFFPPNGEPSPSGVLQPLADFSYQQNICGCCRWNATKVGRHGSLSSAPSSSSSSISPSQRPWITKAEGNTGLFFLRSNAPALRFIGGALKRCAAHRELDDQTNMFNVSELTG